VKALGEVLHRYGQPAVFNSNKSSHYTSDIFTDGLKANSIRIGMDGKVLGQMM